MITQQLDGAGSGIYGGSGIYEEAQSRDSRAESAESSIRRDNAWRHERVATAAYYLAAKRGFERGHEAADWSLAELQIDAIDEN